MASALISSIFRLFSRAKSSMKCRTSSGMSSRLSRRGGIVDVYPFSFELPVRVEMDNDTVVSIRSFNVSTGEPLWEHSMAIILPMRRAGASRTIGELGAVNAIAGAFVVALAAAVTVYWLTVLGYPASATQAIVGAIIGWDLFAGAAIDYWALEKIFLSWVLSPILAAIFSALLYKLIRT